MKLSKLFLLLTGMLLMGFLSHAQSEQDKLNLPGDNLNLYAVLKLFQESATLEIFEKKLNSEDTHVNNLDLNGDNKIDYIKVIDNVDGSVHNIVLQTDISATEKQDIAVIVVQKLKDDQVQVQVIGDEDLYGKNYIVEPNMDIADNNEKSTPNPGYTAGTGKTIVVVNTTPYEIAAWPIVHFIFVPDYIIWHSPWYWGFYPSYWQPWAPYYWHYYWGFQYHWDYYYYAHYRRWNYCRYTRWNDYYYRPMRVRSVYFYNRIQRGDFRNTYSRPDMARAGAAQFRRQYPNAPSANDRLPNFNRQVNTNRTNSNANINRQNNITRPSVSNPNRNSTVRTPNVRPELLNNTRNTNIRPNINRSNGTGVPSTRNATTRQNNVRQNTSPARMERPEKNARKEVPKR